MNRNIDSSQLSDYKDSLLKYKTKVLEYQQEIANADFIIDENNMSIAYIPLFKKNVSVSNSSNSGFLSVFGIVSLITAVIVIIVGLLFIYVKGV